MDTIAQPNRLCYKVTTQVIISQSWFRQWPEFPMAVQCETCMKKRTKTVQTIVLPCRLEKFNFSYAVQLMISQSEPLLSLVDTNHRLAHQSFSRLQNN